MLISLSLADWGTLAGVLAALFGVSVLYAVFLEWSERRFGFVSAYTWLTVVIGVGFTLIGLAVASLEAALLALAVFVASGIPIIARSVINDLRERQERLDHWMGRGGE